jgi:hypothetical protein
MCSAMLATSIAEHICIKGVYIAVLHGDVHCSRLLTTSIPATIKFQLIISTAMATFIESK